MSNDEDLVDEVDDTEREDENSHNVEEVQVVKYDLSFIWKRGGSCLLIVEKRSYSQDVGNDNRVQGIWEYKNQVKQM